MSGKSIRISGANIFKMSNAHMKERFMALSNVRYYPLIMICEISPEYSF
jgi:hypothetical protein